MKQILQTHLGKALLCLLMVVLGGSNAWGETVTYTVTSTTAVSTLGTAPSGSSATYSQTYGTASQMTSGNSVTLTLSGYKGHKITGLNLSMKSNTKGGAGTLSVKVGSTTIAAINPAQKFNESGWHGAWSTSYVDVDVTDAFSNTAYEILEGNNVEIKIVATASSLYCESFTLTYEEVPASDDEVTTTTISDAGITNTDVYVSTEAGTLTATVKDESDNAVAGATVTWTSDNEGVATINATTGEVTLVAAGTVTFTARYAGVSGEYQASSDTYEMTVTDSTPFDGGDVTFVAGTDKGSTTANNSADEVTKSGVTMSSTDAAFATTEYRFYQNSTTTFSTSSGKITKIVFTNAGDKPCSNLSTTVGTYTENTWTGSATSVSFTASAQARASQVVVTVTPDGDVAEPTITGTTPFLDNTEVTITAEDGATIYYTTDGNEPTASSTQYTGAFTVSATTTVKAIAVKDNNTSSVAEATFTKATVMTVAEARAAIDENSTVSDAYVSGIVSQVDSYSDKYSSITYWISDDGTTTNQLEVYSGKGIDGADFSDINGVQEGDVVVVLGTLKLFDSTYEFDKNSVIVRLTTKADPELAFATTEYTVAPGAEFTAPTLTNPNNLTVTYSSSDDNLVDVDENTGEVLIGDEEGTVTITASFAGNATYRAGSASYTIAIVDNTKGTIDNPYTVADVIAGKVTRKSVYVIGYIVGEFNSKTQDPRTSGFTTDANIALADEFTTSPTAALSIPVALPNDDLKAAWGCQTNNGSTIGTKVIVCGNGETYFSVNGIKSTSSVTAVESVTVSSAGYATYCSENALDFTGTDITAYVGTIAGTHLTFTPITQVPANTGILLVYAGGKTENVPVIASADPVQNNCLVGVNEETEISSTDYILNVGAGGGAGFYKAGDYTTLGAHKAYIDGDGVGIKSFGINLTTGIDLPATEKAEKVIFDLSGRRVEKPAKGLYIVNGKKVLF